MKNMICCSGNGCDKTTNDDKKMQESAPVK